METKRMNVDYDPCYKRRGGGRTANLFNVKHAITGGIKEDEILKFGSPRGSVATHSVRDRLPRIFVSHHTTK